MGNRARFSKLFLQFSGGKNHWTGEDMSTSAQRSGNRMVPRQLLEHGAGVGLILARAHVNAGTDLAKYREHR